jgi:putative aldouronate transport system permease protein
MRHFPALRPRHRPSWVLLLFMLPATVFFGVFVYWPIYGMIMAFQSYSPALGFLKSPWVGLENLRYIFGMPNFLGALRNTLIISCLKILISFPAPIVFALLLNEVGHLGFKRSVQTISYLPYFVSWVIVSGLFYKLFSMDGPVNEILVAAGLVPKPILFLADQKLFYPIIILTDLWKNIGWNAIIYLAALAGVDPELYEAARVDGAGRLRQMVSISLPSIAGVIVLLFVLTLTSVLSADFDQLYTMSNAAVRNVGEILDTLVLKMLQTGTVRDYSYGAAMSFFKNTAGFLLFLLANRALNRRSAGII